MNKVLIAFLVFMVIAGSINAEDKIRIAVMDLDAKNVSNVTASIVSDFLRNDLYASKKYIIVERSQMEKILKEQMFQKTGCTTTECAVEVGKILNASQMIVGSLSLLGDDFYVMIRVVDVETAETKFSDTLSCSKESELKKVTNSLISRLTGVEIIRETVKETVNERPFLPGEKTPFDVAWRSALLPGWGQLDNKQDFKGYLIAGGEIVAIGGTIATYLMYNKAMDDYNAAGAGADFTTLRANATNMQNLNTICFWGAVGIWAYGVIDPYLFGVNRTKKFTLDYNGEKMQLAYSIGF